MMKTTYVVHSADWLPDYSKSYIAPSPSNEIDDRTIRARYFDTFEEADVYAKTELNRPCIRWIAYLEIRKHSEKTIKKYIGEKE